MFQAIKRLSGQTLTYGVGTVLTRLVAFLLVPVFTHHLSPTKFGVYSLYYVAIAVAMELVRLGLDISLLRYYVPEKDAQKRKAVFSTVFWAALVFSSVIFALLWIEPHFWVKLFVGSTEPLSENFIGPPPEFPEWMIYTLRLCAGIIWLDNMSAFPLVVMRGEGQAVRFTSVRMIGAVVQVGLTVLFLIPWQRGLAGIFEANLISSGIILLFCIPTIVSRLKPMIDKAMLKACLMFGLPNVPNSIFVVAIELSDRKILGLLRDSAEVGLYSAGYRLGMFLGIVATGFRFAWQPFFLQISDQPDAKNVYSRVLTYYMAVVLWLYLVLTAFVEPLAKWDIPMIGPLIDPEFWPGLAIFPVVLLAHVFNGMYAVFMVGVYIEKKMHVLPLINGLVAALNIGGNLLLVPYFGMWAAAWLTVASYLAMAVILYLYINRHYPIRYEWGRVIHLMIVAAITFGVGAYAKRFGMDWVGYILSVTFPLLLLATGLATKGERKRLGMK